MNVTDYMASEISEVIDGKETGEIVSGEIKRNLPEVVEKIKA